MSELRVVAFAQFVHKHIKTFDFMLVFLDLHTFAK